jgi:hypothetical protein
MQLSTSCPCPHCPQGPLSPHCPYKSNGYDHFNLETAVQDDKVMQDFELESLLMGGDHSQKVKAPPIRSDSNSKS